MSKVNLYALPCPALRAGQGEKKFSEQGTGQGRARQSRAKGRAGQKKVPCDGLWFIHTNDNDLEQVRKFVCL